MKIQTVGRDDELTKLIWRHNHCTVLFFFEPLLVGDLTIRPLAQEVHLDHHWIFEIAENDPEYLLAMDEDDFRAALLEAGFHADELSEQFEIVIKALINNLGTGKQPSGT